MKEHGRLQVVSIKWFGKTKNKLIVTEKSNLSISNDTIHELASSVDTGRMMNSSVRTTSSLAPGDFENETNIAYNTEISNFMRLYPLRLEILRQK